MPIQIAEKSIRRSRSRRLCGLPDFPDPDNYLAGFAIWSGTSFAAPVFAGQVAAALQREFEGGDTGTDPAGAVARGRRVLDEQPQRERS